MSAHTLCVFDLDGTLYRTETSFLPTMRRVYEEFSIEYVGDEAVLSLVGETYSTFLAWLIEQGFPTDPGTLAERITEIEITSIETQGELYPEVDETLDALRKWGCSIALCTNGDTRYATYVLGTRGILSHFDVLKTNDDDKQVKSEMVRSLIAELRPKRTFILGDRYHDIEAGIANNCVTVGAAYGFGKPEELEPATHVIDQFSDLLEIVKSTP